MFSESTIDPVTIQAYLETAYRVHGDAPAILRVGAACPELAAWQEAHRTDCSAFITACNPYSQILDETTNAERQRRLARELEQQGLTFVKGVGQHPCSQWPDEASFLVFGLSLEDAQRMGIRFQQNAIIWSGSDALPRLILLR